LVADELGGFVLVGVGEVVVVAEFLLFAEFKVVAEFKSVVEFKVVSEFAFLSEIVFVAEFVVFPNVVAVVVVKAAAFGAVVVAVKGFEENLVCMLSVLYVCTSWDDFDGQIVVSEFSGLVDEICPAGGNSSIVEVKRTASVSENCSEAPKISK